jgi:hypothetical protein
MAQAPLTLDERMVRVETRFDGIEHHLSPLENRIDVRFKALERRIERVLIAMIAQTAAILGAAVAIARLL